MVVAERALEANPVLHGGIVPDKKPIGGGFVQTAGGGVRSAIGSERSYADSLRQLAACAHKGAYSMGRRGQALTACVGVLKQTYKVLSPSRRKAAMAADLDTAISRARLPLSGHDGDRHVTIRPECFCEWQSDEPAGHLSIGTQLAAGHLSLGTQLAAEQRSEGASGGRSSSPRPGSPRSGRHSPVADDGPDDLTRAVWMTEMSGLDIRAGAVRSCAAAGNLAKAAQNLIAYTREQVRFVRSGLLSYKIKVQEAQRLVAANPSKGKDHPGERPALEPE